MSKNNSSVSCLFGRVYCIFDERVEGLWKIKEVLVGIGLLCLLVFLFQSHRIEVKYGSSFLFLSRIFAHLSFRLIIHNKESKRSRKFTINKITVSLWEVCILDPQHNLTLSLYANRINSKMRTRSIYKFILFSFTVRLREYMFLY